MTYNYREAVKNDVMEAIRDNYNAEEIKEHLENRDDFAERLNDELWIDDSVTGNASGSYTFSTWKAEENLAHNWELMEEVAEMFGCEPKISASWEHGAEWWDVSIRCYLLSECISEALDELEEEYEA